MTDVCHEWENGEKISEMFQSVGLTDFWWHDRERNNREGHYTVLQFRKEGAKNFFEYVGKPLPGFSYKWC